MLCQVRVAHACNPSTLGLHSETQARLQEKQQKTPCEPVVYFKTSTMLGKCYSKILHLSGGHAASLTRIGLSPVQRRDETNSLLWSVLA